MSLLPILAELAWTYARVEFVISEYEPIEAFALLAAMVAATAEAQ